MAHDFGEISLFVKALHLPELVSWELSYNQLYEAGAMRVLVRVRGMVDRDRSFSQMAQLSISGNAELRYHKALTYLQKVRQVDVVAQNM